MSVADHMDSVSSIGCGDAVWRALMPPKPLKTHSGSTLQDTQRRKLCTSLTSNLMVLFSPAKEFPGSTPNCSINFYDPWPHSSSPTWPEIYFRGNICRRRSSSRATPTGPTRQWYWDGNSIVSLLPKKVPTDKQLFDFHLYFLMGFLYGTLYFFISTETYSDLG